MYCSEAGGVQGLQFHIPGLPWRLDRKAAFPHFQLMEITLLEETAHSGVYYHFSAPLATSDKYLSFPHVGEALMLAKVFLWN